MLALPIFFFFLVTMWHWQSHQPFMKTHFVPFLTLTYLLFRSSARRRWKEEGCVLKSKQWRDRRAGGGDEAGEIPKHSCLQPLQQPAWVWSGSRAIPWESLGFSITLPAGDYFSQYQPSPSFPTEHFCCTIQDASSESLIKIIVPGRCFCPSIYKFPSGLSLLPQVHCSVSFLLVSAAGSLQIMTDECGHLHE